MVHFFIIDRYKFSITDKTLNKYTDSLLYEIVNSKEVTVDFVAKEGSDIYIDMDPLNFNNIVKLMRGYHVVVDNELKQDLIRLKLNGLIPSTDKNNVVTVQKNDMLSETSVDKTQSPTVFLKKLSHINRKVDTAMSAMSGLTDINVGTMMSTNNSKESAIQTVANNDIKNLVSSIANATTTTGNKKIIRPKKIEI
jgi:hypothetical protein